MNQNVYFPIKSNFEYFGSKLNQPPLLNKIKQSILMYENLIFDQGSYGILNTDEGIFNFYDHNMADGGLPDYSKYGKFGLEAEFGETDSIDIFKPSHGEFIHSSFVPLLKDLGIEKEDFVSFIDYEFTDDGKSYLKNAISKTESLKNLVNSDSDLFRDTILGNFHESLIISNYLNVPIMVDSLYDGFIQKFSHNSVLMDSRMDVLNSMLMTVEEYMDNCKVPDFSSMDVDGLLDLRKDKLFINFREKILEISNALTEKDNDKLDKIVQGAVITELSSQMAEIAPSREKLVLKISTGGLCLIPGVSELISVGSFLGDVIRGVKGLHEYENSWLTFILSYQG